MEPRKPYPTDLSDKEWDLIRHLVPKAKPGGRPEKYPKREILNGIFYILRLMGRLPRDPMPDLDDGPIRSSGITPAAQPGHHGGKHAH